MHEIIWHGRGGQGVVLAAQILAESAYIQGYAGVTTAPTFGPERRGAPVSASTRVSDEPIRTFSRIDNADIAVVLDESLLKSVDILGGLKKEGTIIINTPLNPDQIGLEDYFQVVSVHAAQISLEQHLFVGGVPVINTPLLGALAKATKILSLESIEKGLKKKMPADRAYANFLAVKTAFDRTSIKGS